MNEHGRRSEKRVAKSMGMKLTPASGALASAKGDFKDDTYLVEAKSTINKSLQMQKVWLDKITMEAMNTNRVPVLHISFVVGSGQSRSDVNEWVCIPAWHFNELRERKED